MTPIDQVRPPTTTPLVSRIVRKKRSTRDSNRDQRSGEDGQTGSQEAKAQRSRR